MYTFIYVFIFIYLNYLKCYLGPNGIKLGINKAVSTELYDWSHDSCVSYSSNLVTLCDGETLPVVGKRTPHWHENRMSPLVPCARLILQHLSKMYLCRTDIIRHKSAHLTRFGHGNSADLCLKTLCSC